MRDRGRARVWAICRCFCCFVLCIFKFFSFRFLPAAAAYWKIFFLAITWRVLAEAPCRATCAPSHAHSLQLAACCLPARLPKVILHVLCTLLYMFNNLAQFSLLSLSRFAIGCGDVLLKWNSSFFFLSISRFQFYFSFFHIFCNNLYSWCVPACRWALSLSHGWCSTTVYWLEFPPPSPPLWRTPLCVATLILNSFRTADCSTEIGANVWVIGSGEFKMI